MRQILLLFAASAAALVTPREARSEQLSSVRKAEAQDAVQAWWDALPDARGLFSRMGERIASTIDHGTVDTFLGLVSNDDSDEEQDEGFHPPHHGHGPRGDPDKTIYELIKESKHTTRFAKLVDDHDEIKQLLQDTEHNHTLFVPTDRAFERLPHHGHKHKDKDGDGDEHEKPSKEFLLALLKYHVVPGLYPRRRILSSQTLPTEFHPSALSRDRSSDNDDDNDNHPAGHPQRLRVSSTPILRRIRLNLHAGVVASDLAAKNGVVHALDAFLLPPPRQTALVRLFPQAFSTFALALERTGVGRELEESGGGGGGHHEVGEESRRKKHIHRPRTGGTLFAPTNRAWARLGPRANAFLFSEPGRKYLAALVRYHVVGNETLYSDAYYREGGDGGGGGDGEDAGYDYWHVDLPTWLEEKPVSVDIRRWKGFGFVSMVVNGGARVVLRDGVANDGVVQVVDGVLIPPHRPHDELAYGEDISVEELKARLEPYLAKTGSDSGEGMRDL